MSWPKAYIPEIQSAFLVASLIQLNLVHLSFCLLGIEVIREFQEFETFVHWKSVS